MDLTALPAPGDVRTTRVLAVWSESPAASRSSFRAAFAGPAGMTAAIDGALAALAGRPSHVYGLHPNRNPSLVAGHAFGDSVVFSPDGVPPFVSLTSAQVIAATPRGEMFGRATADFDGDGGDELVLFERFYGFADAYLVLFSPQLRTAPLVWRWGADPVQDAVSADLDGDGATDLLLATFRFRRNPELFLMRGANGTLSPPMSLGSS